VLRGYALYKLLINLDSFVDGYISFNPNFAHNITYIPKRSLNNILLNLNIINFISIITLISLTLQIMLKFHLYKNIKNIYILLTLIILILLITFAAFIFGDLYKHIGSYVNLYIN